MTYVLSLGAINKLTGEYVYPKIANKKDEYICPECNKDLILCQGKIRVHHFKHKVDNINPCHHYSNPTESQIHKDAKILLKNLLERKIQLSFIRNCCCCKKNEEYEIPEISETSNIQLEYRFDYNGVKTADVAYLDDGEILCIFEICNTHKTCSENRPEPWFEIKAETLIKIANDNSLTTLQIPCIRCEKCDVCIETENIITLNKKIATQKLITWIKTDNTEPFYFRDYDCTIDLINNWSDLDDTKEYFYNVGNIKPDIVMYDKCNERYYIYLNKPSFTDTQIQEYLDHGIGIYFVDIDWILRQKTKPAKIECVKICDPCAAANTVSILNDKRVYLKIEFSKKDLVKEYGGKWHKTCKLWSIPENIYYKNKSYIDKFSIKCDEPLTCEHCNGTGNVKGTICWFCCGYASLI